MNSGEVDTKQATSKQLIAIVFILSLAAKMFLFPVYAIRGAGRDGYIILAIAGAVDLLSLALCLFALKRGGDTDFFELIENTVGKPVAKITAVLFGLYLFFKLTILTSETLAFYSDNVFADFKTSVMLIVLLVFLAAVGRHTLKALARLNELTAPLVVLCLGVLCAIIIATDFDLANILPAVQTPDRFLKSAYRCGTWLGDFMPLLLFVGRTGMKKHTRGIAFAGGVVGTAVTVFMSLAMCAAFGNTPHLTDSGTNLSGIVQFSAGNIYGRVDLFSSILWSVAAIVETALFAYSCIRCFTYAVGRKAHMPISIAVCVVLYFVQVFAMTNPAVFTAVCQNVVVSAISLFFTAALPCLAVACAVKNNKSSRPSRDDKSQIPQNEINPMRKGSDARAKEVKE